MRSQYGDEICELLEGIASALNKLVDHFCDTTSDEHQKVELKSASHNSTAYYMLNLITYKSYSQIDLPCINDEMANWLLRHNKKRHDIVWHRVNTEDAYVGKLSNIVMTGAELDNAYTRDCTLLNICGHPWYIGGPVILVGFKEDSDADSN